MFTNEELEKEYRKKLHTLLFTAGQLEIQMKKMLSVSARVEETFAQLDEIIKKETSSDIAKTTD